MGQGARCRSDFIRETDQGGETVDGGVDLCRQNG